MKGINFKKSYSREFFSLEGKKIFSNILFFVFLLGIVSTGFIFCQNGICPKKVSSIFDNGITGNVIGSEEINVSPIERGGISSESEEYSLGKINVMNEGFSEKYYEENEGIERFFNIKILMIFLILVFFIFLGSIFYFLYNR